MAIFKTTRKKVVKTKNKLTRQAKKYKENLPLQLTKRNLFFSLIFAALTAYFYRKKNMAMVCFWLAALVGHNLFPFWISAHLQDFVILGYAVLNGIYYTCGTLLYYFSGKKSYKHF